MTHRILTLVFLSLTLAFAPIAPVLAQPAPAQSGLAADPTCNPKVAEVMEAQSKAQIEWANGVQNEAVPGPAATAALSCQDKIMGSWAKIGTIFSDTGNGVSKKLIDYTKTFVMSYLAKYLVGNFDIGGFQFDFNFMQSVMSLAGGAFGTNFDGCNEPTRFVRHIKGRGNEIGDLARQLGDEARSKVPKIEMPAITSTRPGS